MSNKIVVLINNYYHFKQLRLCLNGAIPSPIALAANSSFKTNVFDIISKIYDYLYTLVLNLATLKKFRKNKISYLVPIGTK